jgi:hypothetical protein
MQYLIVLSPILLLFIGGPYLRRKTCAYKSIVSLIEGKDHDSIKDDELYNLAVLLIKLRSLYGPKIANSLKKLKSEITNQERESKKIKALKYSALYQQLVMILLISVMIYISASMFKEIKIPFLELILLQLISVLLVVGIEKILYKKLIVPLRIRFKYLLVLSCLSGSSLSVSKVLSLIEWNKIFKTSHKKNKSWDLLFQESISQWKLSGSGLDERLVELESDLEFISENENKRYKDCIEVVKFVSLIISGFLSYFLYLFSLMNSFLS